jgi:hypothetical protein
MPFVAKRSLHVMRDGKKTLVAPGAHIPEAASWPNLRTYLDLRWIENQGGEASTPKKYQPPRKVKAEDAERGKNNLRPEQELDYKKKTDGTDPSDKGRLLALSHPELVEMAEGKGIENAKDLTKKRIVKALIG